MNPYVQTVQTCFLGEGPHWNEAKQELYYVDILDQAVHRYVPSTKEHTRVRVEDGRVTLLVPVEGQPNKYVVSVERSLQMMEWDGKSSSPTSLTSMYSVEPEHSTNRFNDGKCDSSGRLWAGTMNDDWSLRISNLYKVTNNIQTVQTSVGISNGIAWNKENSLMYFIDTTEGRVDVFDFDNELGSIRNRRPVYDYNAVGETGSPDGMTIDSEGNLWVACWAGSQIIQIDPTVGRKIRAIPLPTKNITSIAFGGPNLDVMYITSAIDGLTEAEKVSQPSAGSLFQITNTGARGMSGGHNFRP